MSNQLIEERSGQRTSIVSGNLAMGLERQKDESKIETARISRSVVE